MRGRRQRKPVPARKPGRTPREEFARALRALQEARDVLQSLYDREGWYVAKRREAAAEAWRAHAVGKRGRALPVPTADDGLPAFGTIVSKLGQDLVLAYTAAIDTRGYELHERTTREQRRLEALLEELAPQVELRRGGEWRTLTRVWDSSYATQGWGASSYAKASAERSADPARAVEGLGVRIERFESPTGRYKVGGWRVEARVETDLDLEVLRRLPPLSMRETVRLCWARGVNPRVYWPTLPHGYEEREGIDYQGRDLRASAQAATTP